MSDYTRDLALATALLPGYGFFSPRGAFRLRVDVNHSLKRLRLYFESGQKERFAVPAIYLYGPDGKELNKANVISHVAPSFSHPRLSPEDILERVKQGKGLKTVRDSYPHLDVIFKSDVELSHICLGNRPNDAGQKARHIGLNGYSKGKLVVAFRNQCPHGLRREMLALHKDLNISIPAKLTQARFTSHCQQVRLKLLRQMDKNTANISARRLAQFLPLFEPEPKFTDFRRRVLTEVMARTLQDRKSVSTQSFSAFACLLNSPERLEKVLQNANRIVSKRRGQKVQFLAGKHAFQQGRLLSQKANYLTALDALFPALSACGAVPMLAYGSLLGAVRDKGFMPHDDDVDVLYFDGATSREEAYENRKPLVKKLKKYGFSLKHTLKNANFHLTNGTVILDLFPCWQEDGKLQVMRSYPRYEALPEEVLLPPSEVQLYGRKYPAPADQESFLAWRYGDTWQVPDAYHEWPWAFKG